MLTLVSDVAKTNNFNEDDFQAFCEQSTYAWKSAELGGWATNLPECLVNTYMEYIND